MRPDFSDLISKENALERLFSYWKPERKNEMISVADAAGRVLAESRYALYNLPVVRSSVMDGIAVRSVCFQNGIPDTSGWKYGIDYIRADTGDDFDDAFDAVIAIEDVTFSEDGKITLEPGINVKPGYQVKPCGTDVKKGAFLVAEGTLLTASDLAALAMGGIAEIPVVRKPVVSFLPTGSELAAVGEKLHRGQNFDTNSIMVKQMLREMGAEALLHPIVPDDPKEIEKAFDELLPGSDIVLINAGTSKGEQDYCARMLSERGKVLFHGVAAVPGRPMSMAIIDDKPVINLSGPAFAAFYSMDWAVRSVVCKYFGIPVPVRERITATLTESFRMPPFFSMMVSFQVEKTKDGSYTATPLALRGPKSAKTTEVLTANGVYITRPGEKPKDAGEQIEIELLRNRAYL